MKKDGVTVEVSIIRLEHESEWSLEVVNSAGTSIVWDHQFATDEDAYAELSEPAAGRGGFRFFTGEREGNGCKPAGANLQRSSDKLRARVRTGVRTRVEYCWQDARRAPFTLEKSSFSEPKRDAGNQRHCGNSSPRSHSVGGLRTKPLFSRIKKLPPSQP